MGPVQMDWDDTTNVAHPEQIARDAARDKAYLIVLAGTNVGEMHRLRPLTTLGRSPTADIRIVDDGVSRLHCQISAIAKATGASSMQVEDLQSRNGTYCNGERIVKHELIDGDKIQIGRTTILKFTYHDKLEESFQKQMYDSALRDPLTRAYNKRYFLDRLDSEIRFALRHKTPLSLLMFDLDHFKDVNDSHGHVGGDRALVSFAEHIRASIRNEDVFARYGGEEFSIISRGIPRPDARLFADRLRREVGKLAIPHDGATITFTTSIGVATLPENLVKSPDEMIKCADRALYKAKQTGRDQVVLADSD